ncbi:MAG: hypothetical protein RJA70_1306 [Pseudomonadota bacterium]|jgi:hypothetical protein
MKGSTLKLLGGVGWTALATCMSPCVQAAASVSWGGAGARTIDAGRVEVGAFSDSRVGITRRIELSAHPLVFLILPHLEGKYLWWQDSAWLLSTRHRITYPSLFLNLLAKEGALGLLPADTAIPQALVLTQHAVISYEFESPHAVTLALGGAVAPRTRDLRIVEFPFLYQRLAALHGWLVPEGSFTVEGVLPWNFGYAIEARAYWFSLPSEQTGGLQSAWALEGSSRLDYSLNPHVRFSVLLEAAQSEFPFGTRTHLLPLVDARVTF